MRLRLLARSSCTTVFRCIGPAFTEHSCFWTIRVNGIAVPKKIFWDGLERGCFQDLLYYRGSRRMLRDVEEEDSTRPRQWGLYSSLTCVARPWVSPRSQT